jgi:hypothetical protein
MKLFLGLELARDRSEPIVLKAERGKLKLKN